MASASALAPRPLLLSLLTLPLMVLLLLLPLLPPLRRDAAAEDDDDDDAWVLDVKSSVNGRTQSMMFAIVKPKLLPCSLQNCTAA